MKKNSKVIPFQAPTLKLMEKSVSQETVEALTRLLADAKRGEIAGFAYIALHQGTSYSGDVIGRAKQFPIYTLGLVKALEDLLVRRLR